MENKCTKSNLLLVFFIFALISCKNAAGNYSEDKKSSPDNSEHTVHFLLTFEDRKDLIEFDLTGKGQEKITIPDSYIPADYKPVSYKPHKPTKFAAAAEYEIELGNKYEYFQEIDEVEGIKIPFVCRDFRNYNESPRDTLDGFITDERRTLYGAQFEIGRGHPDFCHISGCPTKGMLETELGQDGLPVFKDGGQTGVTKTSFDMWYKDYPGINKTVNKYLFLKLLNSGKKIYKHEAEFFLPINNEGFGNTYGYEERNYGFTDDFCFYFKYQDGGKIRVYGDDDIWVFVNGKLAIDLGGCHTSSDGIIIFKKEIQQKTLADNRIITYNYDPTYDLIEGQFVEVRIFHAERSPTGSKLDLITEGLDLYQRKVK